MTDKQIIIDGVPVQDCVFFYTDIQEEIICDLYPTCGGCKGIDCYYKQLKRAEQTVEECHKYQAELEDKLTAKEQECEELKEEIKKHNDDMFKNPPEKRFYCKGCTLPYISKKLKQTLAEIKEIAEKIDDSGGCAYGDYDCDNCSSLEQETVCTYKVKKLILQKISEVEDG